VGENEGGLEGKMLGEDEGTGDGCELGKPDGKDEKLGSVLFIKLGIPVLVGLILGWLDG